MDDLISRQAAIDAVYKCNDIFAGDMPVMVVKADAYEALAQLPSAQPEPCEDAVSREEAKWVVFCNRDHVEDQANAIDALPPVTPKAEQPDLSEYSDKLWKKAYERGKAEALAQLEEAYISGETEAEARFHAQQRWIPCSERLPEERQEILATTTDNAWGDVVIIRTYYKEMHKSVIAWMPLPEAFKEGQE